MDWQGNKGCWKTLASVSQTDFLVAREPGLKAYLPGRSYHVQLVGVLSDDGSVICWCYLSMTCMSLSVSLISFLQVTWKWCRQPPFLLIFFAWTWSRFWDLRINPKTPSCLAFGSFPLFSRLFLWQMPLILSELNAIRLCPWVFQTDQ